MTTGTITIRTDPEVTAQIAALATAMDRSRNWVIEEALKQYIESQSWQVEGIRAAQASIADGDAVPFDDVMTEMETLIAEKARNRKEKKS